MVLRLHKRFPVHFHSAFTGPKLAESVGTILNLSKQGCLIEIASQVYTGMHITLHMDVPGAVSAIHIERAAMRWNRGGEIGVGFITVAPPNQKRVDELLERMNQNQQT